MKSEVPFEPVRWGILGTAHIALQKVIPAMQRSMRAQVIAIASRDIHKAAAAARALGIPRAYGSYEELLADEHVEAIYNPLPNHLHVPWSIRAADAGKHVLCEKPLALNAREATDLRAAEQRNRVHIGEAFMVRTHPQWRHVLEHVHAGGIGELRLITGHFSYNRRDPSDIRSRIEYGGGALLDIGCYPITLSRWIFQREPDRVIALIERDPQFGVDRLTSALMQFGAGQSTFSSASQLVPYQRVHLFGTRARLEVEIPFNAPPGQSVRIFRDEGEDLAGARRTVMEFPIVDQYTVQCDHFSAALRGSGTVPVSVSDGIKNMAVIDALFRSAESGSWESPEQLG